MTPCLFWVDLCSWKPPHQTLAKINTKKSVFFVDLKIVSIKIGSDLKWDIWVVVSNTFYLYAYLGKIPILTNIFQRGWNHQLDIVSSPPMIHSASKLRSTSAAPPPKRPRLRGWDDESGETLQRRAEDVEWRRWRIVTSFFLNFVIFCGAVFFVVVVVVFFWWWGDGVKSNFTWKKVWSLKWQNPMPPQKDGFVFQEQTGCYGEMFFGERMYVRNVKVGWLFEVGWTMFAWHLVPLVSVYYTCIHIKNI